MPTYRLSQVADLVGVSTDTVRRWVDDGRLVASRTAGGHRCVEGTDLAVFLTEQPEAYEPESRPRQSARNQFSGIVTRVERDGLVAVVEVHAPPHRIMSLMTREAADDLNLQPGDLATASVKSTNVTIGVP